MPTTPPISSPEHPSEAWLRSIDIHELLPQQEPFVMVDSLTHFDERTTTTETLIRADNLFVDDGRFSASGLIENVAQTCAARIGYYNKYVLKGSIQLGFIGAVRGFCIHSLPAVGEVITTTAEVLETVFGMTLAQAEVRCGERLIATTSIKIALKDDK